MVARRRRRSQSRTIGPACRVDARVGRADAPRDALRLEPLHDSLEDGIAHRPLLHRSPHQRQEEEEILAQRVGQRRQGDERVAIIPATWREDELRQTLLDYDAVVLMKVSRVLPKVIDLLDELGMRDRAALVSRGTANQQIVTRDLERFRDRRLNYLTLVLVARQTSFLDRLRKEQAARAEVN